MTYVERKVREFYRDAEPDAAALIRSVIEDCARECEGSAGWSETPFKDCAESVRALATQEKP